jgi:hypothetical protein
MLYISLEKALSHPGQWKPVWTGQEVQAHDDLSPKNIKYVAEKHRICVWKAQNMWPKDLWLNFTLPVSWGSKTLKSTLDVQPQCRRLLSNWSHFQFQCTGRQGRGSLLCAGLGPDDLCIGTTFHMFSPDQCQGLLITDAPGEKWGGWSSLPFKVSLLEVIVLCTNAQRPYTIL